jgi:putative colanic acid biosynthesis UDP-glucose lipid carrier transferase
MSQNLAVLIRFVFAFLDLLILNTMFFSVKYLFLHLPLFSFHGEYLYFWITINSGWLACSGIYGLYEGKYTQRFESFIRRTFHTYILFLILILLYLYFSRQLDISRLFVSSFLISLPVCLLLNRLFYLVTWLHFRNKESLIKRVLIIGYNESAKKLASYFERNNTHMKVMGFCEESDRVSELSHYPILNTPANAIRTSQELNITEIYSTILPEQDKKIYDLMRLADEACIRFRLVPDFSLFVNQPMHLNYLSGMPVLSPRTEPLEDLANRIKKRIFDIVFSALVIVLILSWLIPLLAIIIWLDSRGPVFFIQKRSGVNNKPFSCIKFRSMYMNNDSDLKQATKNDDRLTRVGRILRKTNLDEFPQFFNVLKGEMSIVGPRPHMLKHTQDYSATISKFMLRQFIKPGITGWAQINGYRGEIHTPQDMQERVDHDLWYMENWSFGLDLKVIFLTGYNLLRGEENAY